MTANASAQEAITVLKTIRLQRFKEAVVALEQARQLEPNSSETSLNLGYAYAKQKRYREAIAEMQKAVRLNPNDEQTQSLLCNLFTDERQAIGVGANPNGEINESRVNTKTLSLILQR